jgi:hypothetical protein
MGLIGCDIAMVSIIAINMGARHREGQWTRIHYQTLGETLGGADVFSAKYWSERQDLNLRPPRPERGALPG